MSVIHQTYFKSITYKHYKSLLLITNCWDVGSFQSSYKLLVAHALVPILRTTHGLLSSGIINLLLNVLDIGRHSCIHLGE